MRHIADPHFAKAHAALSSASESTSPRRPLRTAAPLPAGTAAGEDVVAFPRRTTPTTPSYYRIELHPKNDGVVQLTAGDDASVQFTPETHKRQLKMAEGTNAGNGNNNAIVRASPVIERKELKQATAAAHEAIEHDMVAAKYECDTSERHRRHRSSQQHWTISDSGRIVALPPSPNRVSTAHDYVKAAHSKPRGGKGSNDDDDLSVPPMLVKANSHGSSSTHSDCDDRSYLSANSLEREEAVEEGVEVPSPESPPRMTRSVIFQSLFQDSIGSSSRSQGTDDVHRVGRMYLFGPRREEVRQQLERREQRQVSRGVWNPAV